MKPSINIKYDLSDLNLIDNYLPTKAHLEFINKVLDYKNRNAHIAFGPYGSGKSLITTIVANLLSNNFSKSIHSKLVKAFGKIADADRINQLFKNDHQITYSPIVFNGHIKEFEDNIASEILKKVPHLVDELQDLKGSVISNIIDLWRIDFPETFKKFTELLPNDINTDIFINGIKDNDASCIKQFEEIHYKLSSGARLTYQNDINLISMLEKSLSKLSKHNRGLVLIFDEFGRHISELDQNDINFFMQLIQNLAELANSGSTNFKIIFVTHKTLSEYFTGFDRSLQREFSKVEKRFEVTEINNDFRTYLQITNKFISNLKIEKKIEQNYLEDTFKYNFFKDTFQEDLLENELIIPIFPLHSATAFLLPSISSVFGQNERTLFTFLGDSKEFGFVHHLENSNGMYYPHNLVDYFLYNISSSKENFTKDQQILISNLNDLPRRIGTKDYDSSSKVYKLLLIWSIVENTNSYKMTKDLISFCTGIKPDNIEKTIIQLETQKMIRFNPIVGEYELFSSSSLNLDEYIEEKLVTEKFNIEILNNLFNESFYKKYIYPLKHNSINQMTRYARVYMKLDSEIIINLEKADLNVLINLFDKEQLKENQFDIVRFFPLQSENILPDLKKLLILNLMLNDRKLLADYKNLQGEVQFEISVLENKLNKIYDSIDFNIIKFIENDLDELMDKKYPNSIIINNDQINNNVITNVQFNSFIKVFDAILNTESLEEVFIGSKPQDLIYYSILVDAMQNPKNTKSINMLKDTIFEFISQNNSAKISELFDIAQNTPYGLREYPAILITAFIIQDYWKDFLLYSSGNYIAKINASELIEGLKSPHLSIEYSFSNFDFENHDFLNKLENIFQDQNSLVSGKSLTVRVCSNLYQWYMNLPVITQQKINMSLSESRFLTIISKTRIDPVDSINSLVNDFHDVDLISNFKESIEIHFDNYLESFDKNLKTKLGINNFDEWLSLQPKHILKTNEFAKALTSEEGLINSYSRKIENINLNKWTLSSFKSLEVRILEDFNQISDDRPFTELIISGDIKHIPDTKLSLKANNTQENIENTIEATRKYITSLEIEQIILNLIKKYVR
jgi:hypothetical protein